MEQWMIRSQASKGLPFRYGGETYGEGSETTWQPSPIRRVSRYSPALAKAKPCDDRTSVCWSAVISVSVPGQVGRACCGFTGWCMAVLSWWVALSG